MAKSKRKTKEEISKKMNRFTHNIYAHGGSRMYIDGESGDRQLLIDTYGSKEFAVYLEKCVREFFEDNPESKN